MAQQGTVAASKLRVHNLSFRTSKTVLQVFGVLTYVRNTDIFMYIFLRKVMHMVKGIISINFNYVMLIKKSGVNVPDEIFFPLKLKFIQKFTNGK